MDNSTNSLVGIGMVPIPTTVGGSTYCKLHVGGINSTMPSLQLDYVPSVSSASSRSYLFLDANGVVQQSTVSGINSCTTTGKIPRVTNSAGDLGCSQIIDDGTNVGIGLTTSTSAKLDIDLSGTGGAAGTVRLRNLQANTGTLLAPVLIDANGFLWKATGSMLSRNASSHDQDLQNDKIDKLEQEVKNLKELVELMMKNGNAVVVTKPFTVYPNPAKNIIRIEKSEKATSETNQYVEIRDINNSIVLEKQLFKQSLNITLDNKLSSGTYLLVIYQNQQIIQTEKITIAK